MGYGICKTLDKTHLVKNKRLWDNGEVDRQFPETLKCDISEFWMLPEM